MSIFLDKATKDWKHHAFLLRGMPSEAVHAALAQADYALDHVDIWRHVPENGLLTIEVAREAVRAALGKPTTSSKRIVLLEVEKISLPAQHALLKITEDPPVQTIIIISTAASGLIIPTLLSRVSLLEAETPESEEVSTFLNLTPSDRLELIQDIFTDRSRADGFIQNLLREKTLSLEAKETLLLINDSYQRGYLAPKYAYESLALLL